MATTVPGSIPFTVALALVTLTTGLAGCIGSDSTSDVEQTASDATGPAVSAGGLATFQGAPSYEVIWRNGTFTANENQFTGRADGSWNHTIDVTEKVPEGVVVRLNATLQFPRDASEQVFDNLEVELSAPEEVVLQSRNTDRTIPQYLTAALLHEGQGPIELEVVNQWPTASPETSYTLRIEVQAAASTVPARVPTAVEVPEAAAAIEVQPAEAHEHLSTIAWGPDDGFLGWRATGEEEALHYPVGPAGSYVVRSDAPAHLRLVDAEGQPVQPVSPLEPLRVVTKLGEGHTLESGTGPETWTTDVPKAPVGVSFQVQPAGPAGTGVLAGSDIRVQIATENGTVMDEPFFFPANAFAADGPFFLDGLTGFPRSFADQNTTGGEWTWTAEHDLAANVEIVPVWIQHHR